MWVRDHLVIASICFAIGYIFGSPLLMDIAIVLVLAMVIVTALALISGFAIELALK